VAYASFAVIVHPNNPMTRLSLAQVRAAFTGQVADWVQVGGDSGALQIVTREDGSEGAAIFNTRAGLNAPLTRNTLVAPTWEAMRATVGQTPTALGYLPAPEMDESVRAVQLDAELRVLIVAVAQTEPVGRARDFLVWVQSDVGQQAVAQHYEPVK
jgi:phosphate transport system substrate-binding protein